MKQIIFSLIALCGTYAVHAQNCVTSVRQIGTDYANHQITIALTRSGCTGDATRHRHTAWVFVDYRTVTGATKGTWTRATIGATSAGTVVNSGSSKGVWVYGNNGTQTVTLTLSGMPEKYDWCAFATDYPPNVTLDAGLFTFAGNVSFITSAPQTLTGSTAARAGVTTAAGTSFTDATGCPGIGSLYCPYTGSDLYMDPEHLCRRRPGGAQNWEAWIKDPRDSQLYRLVQMPDNRWWMAQNLNFQKGLVFNAQGNLAHGAAFPVCDPIGAYGIGSFWCPATGTGDGAVASMTSNTALCNVYGALYNWSTVMMVDGRCASENLTSCGSSYWSNGTALCTGTAAGGGANCRRNNARGTVTAHGGGRGICPPGWHVPTYLEMATLFDKANGDGTGNTFKNYQITASLIYPFPVLKNLLSTDTGTGTNTYPAWRTGAGGTDLYGFTLLPSGFTACQGSGLVNRGHGFFLMTSTLHIWDTSSLRPIFAVYFYTSGRAWWSEAGSYGSSVRCIRD